MNFRLCSRMCVCLLFLFSLAKADTWTLNLVQPDIGGSEGQTIGWEYSITNNSSTDWLVLNSLTVDGSFLHGTPDSSVFDYPIIAPDTTVTGLLENLTWDAIVPYGFVNSGVFDLQADFWDSTLSIDLGAAAATDACIGSLDGCVAYSARVVPEPANITLVLFPLVLLAWFVRRKARMIGTHL